MIIPIFLTGFACNKKPCVFCDQELASSNKKVFSIDSAKTRITETMALYIKDKSELKLPLEVAFYGSSFTALDFSTQKELLTHMQNCFEDITGLTYKGNLNIRISTRPDCIRKEELLDLKLRFNLSTVEIGVQSMIDEVLFMSNRGHTRKDVKDAAKVIKGLGLVLSCHQMIGLPGSNPNYELQTAKDIIKLKPEYVRIHPTLVLKGTELEKMYETGLYNPLGLNEAVNITEKILRLYRQADVAVIRIGIHPSELLLENIVTGPWHPSFRELVEGKYLMNEASQLLTDYRGQEVALNIAPQDETYIRGENNTNYNELLKSFELKDLELIMDPNTQRGSVSIRTTN